VPVSYYDDPYTLLSFILNEFVADDILNTFSIDENFKKRRGRGFF
jgi:hypothetical protein